ncbi:hypothetical protein HNQ56_003782 [Anaerotaenia torta]
MKNRYIRFFYDLFYYYFKPAFYYTF